MNLFTKCIGAVAIAASLAATSVAPVQAQGFNFQINPPGSEFSFGFGINSPDRGRRCLTARSLGRAIADQGYRSVRIIDYGRRTTEARGTSRGRTYALIVDSCSGRILDRERLRRW
jgi:hypothetical protein